jgi:hypothetical protein
MVFLKYGSDLSIKLQDKPAKTRLFQKSREYSLIGSRNSNHNRGVMKTMQMAASTIAFTVVLFFSGTALSQEFDEHLLMLRPLAGETWVGHFVNSSDSGLVHVIRWEPILNGKVVKSTKEVAALDFTMETYYFWDWEKENISFLQLTSRGIFSRGTVTLDEAKITLSGRGIRSKSVSGFKQTFEIQSDGKLQDCFYRKNNDEWVQGHLIEYAKRGGHE